MKKLIIGILLVLPGLPGTAIFFPDFLRLIAGGLPAVLILGGLLAVYLGYEEVMAEKEMDALTPVREDGPPDTGPAPVVPHPPEASSIQAEPDAEPELSPMAEPGPEQETEQAPAFAGNTDTFVFHSISCNFSKGKKCTGRFATRDEAIDQGYKPCKICNP